MFVEDPSAATLSYAFATFGVGVLTGFVARYAWRRRDVRGASSLTALMAGVSVWTLCTSLELLSANRDLTLALESVTLGATGVVVIGFVGVAVEISGNDELLDKRIVGLLSIEPVAITLLTATTDLHGLVYQTIEPASKSLDTIDVTTGIAFWLHVGFAYALLATALALVSIQIIRSTGVYRRQAATVLLGALIAIAGNVVRLWGNASIDAEPIGFAVLGGLVAWSIWRYQLIDLVPIAREQVVDTLPDPVVVLDEQDRITDLNEAGITLLGESEDELLGADFDAAFRAFPNVVDTFEDAMQTRQVVRIHVRDEIKDYEVRVAPIEDERGTTRGRILLFHDVSEREVNRRELEHQNEQLERFASVVSHDLRNPLSVAEGYLDLARESGEGEHFETVAEAHDRMHAIIQDVLTMAREGTSVEETSPVSLRAAAETAWSQVDTGDAELVVTEDRTIPADEDRLQRLLENLYRNSVEHGAVPDRSGGDTLTVRIGPIGDDVRTPADEERGFFVEDDGVGIPEADRSKIFEPGHSTGSQGTGLGLSIVRSIAEGHGWSVRATKAPDGGARFEITDVPPIGPAMADPQSSAPDGAQR
ncbi:histidine kinase N-terminal 7TM domain-containing protein [Salinarchaeum sp. Harcht-Bsk1]|uniref:histidine kinase N-terminal 7TM domain-containing protein n=1 Tax=Salinarchaeum sp. Harcht-Bsk1 TaxID=1333523 RepID=UPI0011818D09|nr:histidine kinase N-terminal 7TM domain-containing protein [Salinarchaeum sp. Harcht-Bsk1]